MSLGQTTVTEQKSLSDEYVALQQSFWKSPEKELSSAQRGQLKAIVDRATPGTFDYHILKCLYAEDPVQTKQDLDQAASLNPNHPLVLVQQLKYYHILGNQAQAVVVLQSLKNSGRISNDKLAYTEDVLKGMPVNAVVLTNGFDDTYSMLYLQWVKGMRTDLMIVSIDYYRCAEFRKKIANRLIISEEKIKFNSRYQFWKSLSDQRTSKSIVLPFTLPPTWLKEISASTVCGGLYLIHPTFSSPQQRLQAYQQMTFASTSLSDNYLPFLFFLKQEAERSNAGLVATIESRILQIAEKSKHRNDVKKELGK